MRLLIAAVGKLKQGPERDLFAHYLGRAEAAGRKLHLSPLDLVEVAESKAATVASRRKAEAEALTAKIPSLHRLIALDRTGEALSSEDLRRLVGKASRRGRSGRDVPDRRRRRPGRGDRERSGEGAVARADDACRMGSPASFLPNNSTGPPRSWPATPITGPDGQG